MSSKLSSGSRRAFCVSCREEREMQDEEELMMPLGRKKEQVIIRGTCPVCGTGLYMVK